jgi:hypothetical protein
MENFVTTKIITVKEQRNQQTLEPEVVVFMGDIKLTSLSKFDPKLITMFGTSAVDECKNAARLELEYWKLTDAQIESVLEVVMENAPKPQPKPTPLNYTPQPKPTNRIERELQEIGLTSYQYDKVMKVITKYNLME